MAREVWLAPFFRNVMDSERLLVTLESTATCGDVLAEVARQAAVDVSDLALFSAAPGAAPGTSSALKLHNSEKPPEEIFVKGLSLAKFSELSLDMVIVDRRVRSLELEQGLLLQEELMREYRSTLFQARKDRIQQECLKEWQSTGAFNVSDYSKRMRPVLWAAQQKVLPKYGFTADTDGMFSLQAAFRHIDPHPAVLANVERIADLVGQNFSWVGDMPRIDDEDTN
mmetsp:Transcript_38291/g.89952  ORF Transcript_38291/g.89952 Transcript_38291/m.89952 type:complete len:226 (+) Transcript_38291:3-680(+)